MKSPLYASPRFYEKMIRLRHRRSFGERMNKISKILEGKRVVELGCGTGHNSTFLKECRYKGFDMNRNFVNHGKKRKRNVNIGDVFNIKLKNYDSILIVDLLHHLPNHKKLLSTAVKSGKEVVVCEPFDMKFKNSFVDFAFRKLNKWIDSDGINPHIKWYSKTDLKKFFRKFGNCTFEQAGNSIITHYNSSV